MAGFVEERNLRLRPWAAITRSNRSLVSITDSLAGSASSIVRRRRARPGHRGCEQTHEHRSSDLTDAHAAPYPEPLPLPRVEDACQGPRVCEPPRLSDGRAVSPSRLGRPRNAARRFPSAARCNCPMGGSPRPGRTEVDRDREASRPFDQRRLPTWQTPAGGGKDDVGVIGNGAQCVNAATQSAPARTEEVILGESVPSGPLKIEGTCGERYWNHWSSRHGPESWARRPRNGTQPKKDSGCWEKRDSTALDSRSAAHSRPKKKGQRVLPLG